MTSPDVISDPVIFSLPQEFGEWVDKISDQ